MPFLEVKLREPAGLFRRVLHIQVRLDKSAGRLPRALQYAFYNWTQDMTWSRRLLTTVGLFIQVGALSMALVGARSGLLVPKKLVLFVLMGVIYVLGLLLMNAMLTSEFVRKTQLQADQLAAQKIQQTHPQRLRQLPGYQLDMLYRPLRAVGGDYFDVIDLRDFRTLIAIADVSDVTILLLTRLVSSTSGPIASSEATASS